MYVAGMCHVMSMLGSAVACVYCLGFPTVMCFVVLLFFFLFFFWFFFHVWFVFFLVFFPFPGSVMVSWFDFWFHFFSNFFSIFIIICGLHRVIRPGAMLTLNAPLKAGPP